MSEIRKPYKPPFKASEQTPFVKPQDIITNAAEAKKHLTDNYPSVALLLEECERAEVLRQSRSVTEKNLHGTSTKTNIYPKISGGIQTAESPHLTKSYFSPESQTGKRGNAEAVFARSKSLRENDQETAVAEFAPRPTISGNSRVGATKEWHLALAKKLQTKMGIEKLNEAERQFCASFVENLKTLPHKERQKALDDIEESVRAIVVIYLAEEIAAKKRDTIILGRTFVKAIIYTK